MQHQHLTDDELLAHLQGQSGEDQNRIESHLESCDACSQRAMELLLLLSALEGLIKEKPASTHKNSCCNAR